VVVWVLVGLAVLIGVLALGLDGGRLMEERRRAQNAADAAALAAANVLYNNALTGTGANPCSGQCCDAPAAPDAATAATTAAQDNAKANGYANDGTTATVTVNIPPKSGAFAGQSGYAEVIIVSNVQASFSATFTGAPLQVQVRAVARGRPKQIGVVLLQSSGDNAFTVNGNGSVTVVGAPVVINSTGAQAFTTSGNASVKAAFYDVAGGTGPTAGAITGTVYTDVPPTSDPLAPLAPPDPCQYPVRATATTSISDQATLQPGVYRGGISLSGDATVMLSPGIYILDGGNFSLSGNASVTGQGVLIYVTGTCSDGLELAGNGTITLTPPTTGPYTGISLWQASGVKSAITLKGNGTSTITGLIYAPSAAVTLAGNGGADATFGSAYVVQSLNVSGNGSFLVAPGSVRPRVPDIRLVE
jgi:hypothetical protein